MNTALLQQIGLGGLDAGYLVIGIIALAVLVLVLLILLILQMKKQNRLQGRLAQFTTGKDGSSLEEDIAQLFKDNQFLKEQSEKNSKDISTLYKKMESAYQKLGIVKYDAFNQMGGKLSFCLALLDENNNGFVLNSVHSSEGCYSYTKTIKNGECKLDLGKEEAKALEKALGKSGENPVVKEVTDRVKEDRKSSNR